MNGKGVTIVTMTVVSAISLLLVFIFNALNTIGVGSLFNSTVGNVSRMYETDVTPAGYTFSIWGVIYFWQAAWMIYALSTICRRNANGPVLLNPVVLPITFHVFWIASCILNITWLFLWDQEQLLASFIVLLLFTLSGYATVAFQAIETSKNEDQMRKESRTDLILIYVLIQNGTDIIYSWTTVATMLNLSIALTYSPEISNNLTREAASTVALSILLVMVIAWSVLENTVFFKFFRFIYSWYGVLVWASIGVLVKNYDPANPNTIITIVVLVVALVCLGIKIGVYFYRTRHLRAVSEAKASAGMALN